MKRDQTYETHPFLKNYMCFKIKRQGEDKEMENKLEIYIEVRVSTNDQIKVMVKLASEIQKEYICHCTLSVKKS